RGPLLDETELRAALSEPGPERIFAVAAALRAGWAQDEVRRATGIDGWFIDQIAEIVEIEQALGGHSLADLCAEGRFRALKRMGFSDLRLAQLVGASEADVRAQRLALGVRPVFLRVDTCAAEFASETPYLYASYEELCEARPTKQDKVMILGAGPNRIGQGIEFDYCCVHAALALRAAGIETIMVNCNPETVSTDYDTADRLYFEPL